MYFSIYPLSEYYSINDNDIIHTDIIIDEKDICIICLMKQEQTNKIKQLSSFPHIISTCGCNPKIHISCLDNWIKHSLSCPICRTKISINLFQIHTHKYFHMFLLQNRTHLFHILCYISFMNFVFIFFYNIYSLYFFTQTYYEELYDEY